MLRSHSLGEHSVFEKTLEAGLSAMKTHQCFLDKTKSNGCPGNGLFYSMKFFMGKMKKWYLEINSKMEQGCLQFKFIAWGIT